MSIYQTAVKRPITTILIFLGIAIFGLFSLTRLSIDLYPDIDWQDVILNPTSFQHTQYVSAQGGGNIARYFASLGMSQESSAYKSMDDSKYNKGVGYDTYNFRTNIDINLTKTTQIYLGAMGFMSVNKRPSMGKKYSRTDTSHQFPLRPDRSGR